MDLNLESLRCFETVARWLNFRKAASSLAISPAALSDRIQRLEEQLGEELFRRTTRKVSLTVRGERLLPHARELIEAHARFFELARSRNDVLHTELWLGTRYDLGLSWLVPGLVSLERADPHRTLHLHFGEGPDLLESVRHGTLDCVVTSSPIVGGALDFLVIHPEEYVFVGLTEVLARNPVRKPEDVLRHRLLDLQPDLPLFRYFLDAAEGNAPWRFSQSEFLGTIGAVRLRMLQGKGLAVLPRYFVAADLKKGRLKRIMARLKLRTDFFRLVWRRDHPKAEAIQKLGADLRNLPLK